MAQVAAAARCAAQFLGDLQHAGHGARSSRQTRWCSRRGSGPSSPRSPFAGMSLPCARWSERAVHAGYTQRQQVAECNGHERSRRVTGNCRSSHRPRYSQAGLHEVGQSSSLPPPPTGLLLARSARTAAWPTPATCWTAPPMAFCWMTTAPPIRRKSRPRFPNCSPAGRTTPSGSAATSARAPGPAKPNKELWASSSPGRARYGATGTGGSLRGG